MSNTVGWTILGEAPRKARRRMVVARCNSCKRVSTVDAYTIKAGTSKRCKVCSRKHGQWRSLTYKSWRAAIGRCENERNIGYANYGARGVTVCARWRESFSAFLEDMGPRQSRHHSLDRIDTNGNYEPGNCRWATTTTQARNKRTNTCTSLSAILIRALHVRGARVTDLMHAFGVSRATVWDVRHRNQWANALEDLVMT